MRILFWMSLLGLLAVACSGQTSMVQPQPSPEPLPEPALVGAVEAAMQPIVSPAAVKPLSPTAAAPSFLCPGDARPDEAWQCREVAGDGVRRCTAGPDQEHRCYEDLDHRFALSLPTGWSAAVTERHTFPGTMVKRHQFSDLSLGHAELAVFLAGGQELNAWLAARQQTSPGLFPLSESNAHVAGRPAAVWLDCPQGYHSALVLVTGDGEHVYWWQHFAYVESGVLPLRALLDSFRLSPEAAVPAAIPDPLWQEAVAGCSQSQAPGDEPPLTGAFLLFARHDELWQADLDGHQTRQVTQGGFLNWGMDDEAGDWFRAYLYRPTQVAPNGRYLSHSQTGRDLLLLDLAGNPAAPEALPRPGAPRVAWSPDSRYLAYAPDAGLPTHQAGLYLYDLESGAAQRLLSAAEASDIAELVWSPDGRFLAFGCCYTPPEDSESAVGVQPGLIRRLEVATGALATVAETTRSVGGGTARLCWTSDGDVAEERDVAPEAMARCSSEGPEQLARSLHGRFQASLAPLSPEDHFWRGPSRLSVINTETGEVQWQLDLEIPATRVFWSPDDRWLFLDSRVQASFPIWRLPADGRGEVEVIIGSGFLLEIVASGAE
jgi:hypothetical protein